MGFESTWSGVQVEFLQMTHCWSLGVYFCCRSIRISVDSFQRLGRIIKGCLDGKILQLLWRVSGKWKIATQSNETLNINGSYGSVVLLPNQQIQIHRFTKLCQWENRTSWIKTLIDEIINSLFVIILELSWNQCHWISTNFCQFFWHNLPRTRGIMYFL